MPSTLAHLDAEWRRIADTPAAYRGPRRWAAEYPALAGVRHVDEILLRRRDVARSGPMLTALANLAPIDRLAARTLLQALIPGLVRLAREAAWDDGQGIEEMVALAWERIRTYPPTRRGSVAANVLWDVRKAYRRHREIDAPTGRSSSIPALDREAPSAEEEAMPRAIAAELVDRLVTAYRRGVITKPALELIVQTRLHNQALAAAAAQQGVTVPRATLWRWRAERRLEALPLAA